MTENDTLILSSLMEIKGDIGILSGVQAGILAQIADLDKSMEALELTYTPPTVHISKTQIATCVSVLLAVLGGLGMSTGVV